MRRQAAGFTLLEIVLAMTMLALLSAICYGAFYVGIRAVERGEVAVVSAQRLRATSDVFTRQVRSVEPFPRADGFGEPYFVGTSTSVSFVTAAAQLGGGGLAQVTYRLEGDPPRLVLEEVPFFSAYTVGRPGGESLLARTAVLLEGVEGLEFKYLRRDEDDCEDCHCDHENWCSVWDTSPSRDDPATLLPVAVRLYIAKVPGLDTEVWGQETPLAVATYYNDGNREANEGLSIESLEGEEQEAGDDDGDDGDGGDDDLDE